MRLIKVFTGQPYDEAALWLEQTGLNGIAILKGTLRYAMVYSASITTEVIRRDNSFALCHPVAVEGLRTYFLLCSHKSTEEILESLKDI